MPARSEDHLSPAQLLANEGATVHAANEHGVCRFLPGRSLSVNDLFRNLVYDSDVVVTGVPSPSYSLPVGWVRPGTVVINVSNFKNVDEDELMMVPGVRYVPLIGKVTVAMLEHNLLSLIHRFHDEQE